MQHVLQDMFGRIFLLLLLLPLSKLPARVLGIWDAPSYNQSESRATRISAKAFLKRSPSQCLHPVDVDSDL